jgi:hypothetical protein
MTKNPAARTEAAGELAASLSTSSLGMDALMDLMAHAPLDHRVRTVGLHALMLLLAEQLAQAQAALVLLEQQTPDDDAPVT